MIGAILIASGRVPNTQSILKVIKSFLCFFLQIVVRLVIDSVGPRPNLRLTQKLIIALINCIQLLHAVAEVNIVRTMFFRVLMLVREVVLW